VRVVGDPGQDVRDRFDRLLAYVYVAGSPTSVNERLVRDGAARVYVFRPASPFALVERFRRAEGAARAARRGLWGPPCNSSLASGTAPNG
jgi:micrococcal nuclease